MLAGGAALRSDVPEKSAAQKRLSTLKSAQPICGEGTNGVPLYTKSAGEGMVSVTKRVNLAKDEKLRQTAKTFFDPTSDVGSGDKNTVLRHIPSSARFIIC